MRLTLIFLIVFLGITNVYGDDVIHNSNVESGCFYSATINALFEPNEYTCANGYFLPANYDHCVVCPNNSTCNGGTFIFNENTSQGIVYGQTISSNLEHGCDTGFSRAWVVVFEPNEHTCPVGQYMPANTDGCVACPADSYCAGGTYTFNETVTQGIESCPNSLYSPAGSSSVAQCGRILHVGDNVVYLRSVKQTIPSLNVQIGNDIFYGNMTTADVPMNSGTAQKLKARFNDTTYSIYDDTVTIPE